MRSSRAANGLKILIFTKIYFMHIREGARRCSRVKSGTITMEGGDKLILDDQVTTRAIVVENSGVSNAIVRE